MSNSSHAGKYIIPISVTPSALVDDNLPKRKEMFNQQMQAIDMQMNELSSALSKFYHQNQVSNEMAEIASQQSLVDWDVITNSPLIYEHEGMKVLRLQFDVSQFDPSEIEVMVRNEEIVVSAIHDEKSPSTVVHREMTRSFPLPKGTIPETVESTVTKDGVLLIQAPLAEPAEIIEDDYY